MKMFLIVVSILLLLLNGIGALYGGYHLIAHPDGSSLQLTTDWLEYSPFDDFLIPGIVLFLANGLGSIFVIFSLIFQFSYRYWLVIIEGSILLFWIIIQVLMLRVIDTLHIIFFSVGLLLILLGYLLIKSDKRLKQNVIP